MTTGSCSVLAIDDDVDLLGMIEILLIDAGFRVITARDGEEALQRVDAEMPGVILLDMKMPGMNGWEFAREFRSRFGHAAPIVVLTAAEDAKKRAQEVGAEGFLGKPFEIEDLVQIVKSQLQPCKAGRSEDQA